MKGSRAVFVTKCPFRAAYVVRSTSPGGSPHKAVALALGPNLA